MTSSSVSSSAPKKKLIPPKIKAVALPAEHGGWGFLLEPILLGLILAPSTAGIFLGIGIFSAFLIRQPARLMAMAWQKRKGRHQLAEKFVGGYGAIAVICFFIAYLLTGKTEMFTPYLIALPLILIQAVYDYRGDSRALIPELSGATALAATAASMALIEGWDMDKALTLWVILAARAIPSIFYIRARLRLEKDLNPSFVPAAVSNLAGVLVAMGLYAKDLAPFLAIVIMIILALRAAYGLSDYRPRVKVSTLGFQEIGFGLLTVLFVAVGYGFQL